MKTVSLIGDFSAFEHLSRSRSEVLDNPDRQSQSLFVKLSNKGRYGVKAIFDIAFHSRGRATQIKEIAERQAIPPRFLEQIFQDLKRAGLVTSKRGPRGGYQLAVEPAEIRLGDIIRALEGPVTLAAPKKAGAEAPAGDSTSREVTEEVFEDLAEQIEACFDSKTIEDLCERGEALGYRRRSHGKYVYVI